jgi:hypothetical protein
MKHDGHYILGLSFYDFHLFMNFDFLFFSSPTDFSPDPACGQAGLFAARDLAPGELILPYLGEVHIGTYPFGRPPENDRALGLSLEGTGAATVVICSSERHDGDLSTGTRGDAIENPSSEMKCDFNPSSLLNPTPAAVPDDTVAAATDDKRNNPPEHKEEGDQEDDDYDYAKSDYDLWLDRDADLAVDAARMGNEARFINDYRGVPDQPLKQQGTADTSDRNKGNKKNRKMKHQGSKGQNGSCDFDGKGQTAKTKTKPNAEFRVAWDPRTGEKCMAVFVVRAGKKAVEQDVGIREGEEILVSYGRGFWAERRREMEEGRGRDGDGEK